MTVGGHRRTWGIAALAVLLAGPLAAQEPADTSAAAADTAVLPGAEAEPGREGGTPEADRTVRLENERVRVVEIRYPPGAASPLHEHAHPRVVHVLAGGVLELASPSGDTARLTVEPGQTVWRPAERHTVRNVGETPVRVLEVEVKGGG